MMMLTLQDLLSRLRDYLEGKNDFSTIREWVYEFYEGETSYALDEALEEALPVLLSYLQYEEAEQDVSRNRRMRRVYLLLNSAGSAFAERTVFGLEFDEIRELTGKLSDALITAETYQRRMATLSPAPYDLSRLLRWASAHRSDNEPVPAKVI